MDVLRPLDDSDSVFLLLTKRLNLLKFHELLNKIQEFMAGLREEDLTDGTLKELTVKRDATGRQTVLLNYNPVPQPHPTQVQAQPPVQTQPQPQPQLQPQQQVQHQLQPPLQAQVQPPVQQQVQVQAQPQPQVQTQTQPQLPIQQQQLPKLQQTQPLIQPQIQINHPQKQVPEPYYQPQTIQYEGPQPVKKVKMDQSAHSETNNQQVAAPMDNGGYNQQKHNAMKPELPRTTYSEYEEYDQAKDTWRISGQQSSHGNMNLSNFSSSFRGGQSYPPLNTMSTISSMSTMSSLNSTMTADIQQPRTKSINYYQEDSGPSHPSDTPKFPNQHTLAAYVEKIWKENPTLQENNDIVERNDKSHNFNSKSYPVFESSFVKIDPPNFYIDAVKPGLVSKKLSQALGMASEKEAPPYLSKLLKVGLPGTYREETFYGINARVPKDFDKESWLKAGVSPTMFETEKMDVVAQQDVQNKNKGKEGEAHIPGVLSDTDYLDRFLRKPQTFYGKTGAPLKTIEIDD